MKMCPWCDATLKSQQEKKDGLCRDCVTEEDHSIRRDVFECIAADLPDGAYLAMAEEFGLNPEDLI